MVETLTSFLISIGSLMVALFILSFIILGLDWLFTRCSIWIQASFIVVILCFFAYAIIDGIINYEEPPAYYEEMYPSENGFDRYR